MLTKFMLKKALIFDMDSTLVDASVAYKSALDSIGISESDSDFIKARQAVKARLPQGHTSTHHRVLYIKQYLELKKKYSHKEVLDLANRYEISLQKSYSDQWLELKRPSLFAELKRKYKLAVVTNETTRTQLLKLSALDSNCEWFETVVTSEEVGVEKPHQKIFDEVYLRLNMSPKDCVIIGDDLQNDILPALKNCSQAIWTQEFISSESKTIAPQGAYTIQRLDQLTEVLKGFENES